MNPTRCPVCRHPLPSIPLQLTPNIQVCDSLCAELWEEVAYYEPRDELDNDPERDNRHGECATWDEEQMR